MAAAKIIRLYILAAIGLVIISSLYLSYTFGLPTRVGLTGHKHALESAKDAGLEFPNDPVPRQDFVALSKYPANNILEPSKFAFATFYCSRDPDPRGPYFETTQSVIYRILWAPFRSKYPVIVFVCPFIPEENRNVFRGQGAIVKEIELLDDIIPDEAIATKRWIDVLSKLNVWKEIEWKRIVFLDSDALPLNNVDDIFDVAPIQHCKKELLSPADKAIINNGARGQEMCDYVYAGVPQFTPENINAGMLVIKPNLDMHSKLIHAARRTEDYNPADMEQGVLRSKNAFDLDGPFPVHRLHDVWNTDPNYYRRRRDEGMEGTDGPIRILHTKGWNRVWGAWNNMTELNDLWDIDWMHMCRFYDSQAFVNARRTGVFKTDLELLKEKENKEELDGEESDSA